MNYTKGPWVVSEDNDFGKEFAVTNYERIHGDMVPICEMDVYFNGHIGDEQKANIDLIAAAPDLYECLIMAKSLGLTTIGHDSGLSHKEFCRMAASAILKAEGREV
jgi:hypothetical protein